VSLTAQLSTALDSSHIGASFLSSVGSVNLNAVSAPADGGHTQAIVTVSAHIDAASLTSAITSVAQRALPIIASLPEAQALLGNLNGIVVHLEDITQQNVAAEIDALLTNLRNELQIPPEGSRFALLMHLIDVLSNAPEGRILRELVTVLAQRAGIDLPAANQYVEGLRALDGLVRALGGMMCLESVLSEAERLSRAMASTAAPGLIADRLAAIDAALDGLGLTLADFVAGVTAEDTAGIVTALDAVVSVAGRLDAFEEELSAALGMGEATLVYLDMTRLQAEVELARTMVRTADLDPLRHLLASVAPVLKPFVDLDLSTLPPGEIGALLTRLEGEIASIAGKVTALDPATFVTPLTDGIRTLTTPLREANQIVAGVTVTLRAALGQVRDAVAALPLQSVADALRTFLEPIAHVLDAIRALLQEIEAALHAAAATAMDALHQIDAALDAFKGQIDTLFTAAKTVLDAAHLDQILGEVGQNIQAFADLLSQANMQPYFDTAVGAINTATSVVSVVPFGLLPESMKAEVDEAVKPVRDTDADAAEQTIEGLIGLRPDGTLSFEDDIEAAKEEVRAKYQALLDAVDAHDPRTALASVDAKLKEIAQKVRELSPELTLQPVADAIDSVKQVIRDVDLHAALQPVRDVFTQIDAALDRYSPSQLVAPLEQRITAVRTAVIAQLHLDKWSPALDDMQTRGLALLDRISSERVRALFDAAGSEIMALLQQFPEADATRPFGTIVAGLLGTTGLRIYPSSFPVVAGWIAGASGTAALAAHTDAIADAFALTRQTVESVDLQAISTPLITRMSALRTSVQGLVAKLDSQSDEAVRLNGLLPHLDAAARFATLTQNRDRYLSELVDAAQLVDQLRRTGFSEVDVKLTDFRAALEPLHPAWRQLQTVMAAMGIDPQHLSVTGIVQAMLSEASPERLANLLMPLLDAFRDRIRVLLTAVIAPLKDAVNDLTTLINAIDLAPLTEAADGVVKEVKEQIHRLSPDELLKEPLASFEQLKQALVDSDPLSAVTAILTALRDAIARLLEKLSLEKLLETPLSIYDGIKEELRRIDPSTLLDPVITQVEGIAHQVDSGLDQTVEAFKQLQAALPSGGGGVSSVSVGASASVG